MNCRICTRCGRCGKPTESPIVDSGTPSVAVKPVQRPGLGLAADIGTTTIAARVYDLSTGRLVRRASLYNPQRSVAADVMGRISAALDGRLDELRLSVRSALRSCLGGLVPAEAVVVGNTTMLHLLAGESPGSYAVAPFRAKRLFGERVALDGIDALLPRCAHAFWGADAVAAALASGMCGRPGPELFADVGTNGELAVSRGGRLTVASVAAGPAFERPGIRGSDLVTALADALDAGTVDATGLVTGTPDAGLVQSDVRAVQLAKAALSAGLSVLMERTGTHADDVTRLTLAGGLGTALDPAKAARIGLIPSALAPRTRLCGNLALEGASMMLLDPSLADAADRLARESEHVELGGNPEFSKLFMASMGF